jgi:hypothetical protein
MKMHLAKAWIPTLAMGLSFATLDANAAKSTFSVSDWAATANGKSVDVLAYKTDAPIVYTPGSVTGTGLIDSFTRPDGSRIPLADAAYLLANKLLPELSALVPATWNNKIDPLLAKPVPKDKDVKSYQSKSSADYVFEIVVPQSMLTYKPTAWATYRIQLVIESRLIDNSSGNVMWKYHDRCLPTSDDGRFEIHNDQFATNDGQRMKELLTTVVDECAALMVSNFKGEKPTKKK